MRTTFAVLAAGLLLTVAGCGSGDDDEAAKAISDSIMAEQGQGGGAAADVFTMRRGEADCIGEGFVDRIGVDQLQEYGLLTEDLEAEPITDIKMETGDAESATDVLFDCADVPGLMNRALAAGGQLDERTRSCLEDVLSEDRLRDMFTLIFRGKQEQANQQVVEPMMECAAQSME